MAVIDPWESVHTSGVVGYAPMATTTYQGQTSDPYANPQEFVNLVVSGKKKAKSGGTTPATALGAGAGLIGPVAPENPDIIGALPAAAGALSALGLPGWLAALLGVAGAGFGIYQALGGGEGGGILNNNLLGGDEFVLEGPGPDVILGGPGLPEPAASMVAREWRNTYQIKGGSFAVQFYQLIDGRIISYNQRTKQYKMWKPTGGYLSVIGKNMPSHRMLTRLHRNLKRHTQDAKTILKIASPGTYLKTQGYYKRKRR